LAWVRVNVCAIEREATADTQAVAMRNEARLVRCIRLFLKQN
jgi:hypothetical protein